MSKKITVYIVKVPDTLNEKDFEFLLKFVNHEKKERILRQKVKQNANNMLIGEILAKIAIRDNFCIPVRSIEFSTGEHGKPYISSHPHIHFNISHSGEYVICAVADTPIGADIEKKRKYKPGLAQKICSEKETEQIEICSDKDEEFTKLWTRKEAVLKMHGTGITNADIKNCLLGEYTQTAFYNGYFVSIAFQK